jgi:hypothetical protein
MQNFTLGSIINRSGYVTQKIYLSGKNLREVEQLLGYAQGRLKAGAWFCELMQLPTLTEFELAGYSQVAEHRFKDAFNTAEYDKDQNALRTRKLNAASSWQTQGNKSLIKVIPVTEHNVSLPSDEQYVPGQGIPQWKLTRMLPFKVASFVTDYPLGKY